VMKSENNNTPEPLSAGKDGIHPNDFKGRGFLLAITVLLICFCKPLYDLARFAEGSELYSYILLIPFISGYLLWLRRPNLPGPSEPARKLGMLLCAGGSVMLAFYLFTIRSVPGLNTEDALAWTTFSFLLFLFGVSASFLGRNTLRSEAFPIGFLIFMVPLPVLLMDWIVSFLQYSSAATANVMFKLIGTPVFNNGVEFKLPGMTLLVAPECSGIHSTMVLFIVSVIAGYLFLRSPWKRTFLTLVVIPLAILRNGFRIFTIGELCVHVGPHMIDSPIHHRGGPIFFALSLVPFFLLLYFFRRSDSRKLRGANPKTGV